VAAGARALLAEVARQRVDLAAVVRDQREHLLQPEDLLRLAGDEAPHHSRPARRSSLSRSRV
jgi:hypothetical protein